VTPIETHRRPKTSNTKNDQEDRQKAVTVVSTDDGLEHALYTQRESIYPRAVHGVFATWRTIMVALTLGVYYFLPWINWGEGRQAFLIDLPARKFHLFWWTFWPQDLFYLTAVLIISALSLFLFTAVAGRLWCGYTCPQTVWTEVFLWIERKIEGDRPKQMKLAKQPWNSEKVIKKGSKHFVWILFSLWTGFTFVGYFTPIRELSQSVLGFSLGPWETFWIAFYGFATYGNAGWLREQVCIYLCPYARFQSAMFDRDTLIISYDGARGEPRGSRQRRDDYKGMGLGDCIDCTFCIQVCPTGIDIRDGLQYQCIACGACIDACDTVMDKMGYAKGLIRHTTENELAGKPNRILRARVVIYASLLTAVGLALIVAVLLRVPLDLDITRDRKTLYRETDAGLVENVYILKILNMDNEPHRYVVNAEGIKGLGVNIEHSEILVEAGGIREIPVWLQAHPCDLAKASTAVTFKLHASDNPKLLVRQDARFLGPAGC